MSVDPVPGFFAPVAAFPFPDDRFGEVWCSLSTRSWTRPASGERPTTPSLAAALDARETASGLQEAGRGRLAPRSGRCRCSPTSRSHRLLRSAAATARASAPRSARTTYVPDPAVDAAEAVDAVLGWLSSSAVAVLATEGGRGQGHGSGEGDHARSSHSSTPPWGKDRGVPAHPLTVWPWIHPVEGCEPYALGHAPTHRQPGSGRLRDLPAPGRLGADRTASTRPARVPWPAPPASRSG